MGIQERKVREKSEMQGKILKTAAEIMKAEGIGGISIRKIAEKIEYSPAIVYHYFKDKEDIVNHIIVENYQQLLALLSQPEVSQGTPEAIFQRKMRQFIDYAVSMGETYKMIMLSESPTIVARTSVLHNGAASEKPAIALLCGGLRQVYKGRDIDDKQLETLAQVIWSSAFGLIMRLIIENVYRDQKECLIDGYIDFVMNAIRQKQDSVLQ